MGPIQDRILEKDERTQTAPISEKEKLERIANRIRIRVVKMIANAGSGHAGGAVSMAEILAVLYFHEMRYDPKNPAFEDRDRFILSKGHGSFALYSTFAEVGFIPEETLYTAYSTTSPCQAHPEFGTCPGIEMSTGALGQGLSAGVGMALGSRLKGKDFRVYVVVGCGESHEGQIWEALMCAAKYKLDNLVAIVDYNKHSLSGRTTEVMPIDPLYEKGVAFGWHVIEVNGHSVTQLINAFELARTIKGKPTMIIAHTIKGQGISYIEDKTESHSIIMTPEQVETTLRELGCAEHEIHRVVSRMKEKK